jgi:DNA polymerase-3 subunit beta
MKVKILSENLTTAITEASHAIAKRPHFPQAECVLLETVDGRLRVTGTDLETAISVYSGAQVIEEGKALIKAGMLARMLPSFDGSAVDIELDGKHGLALSSGGRTFKLAGMDPADYPPIPETPDHVADIGPLALRGALERVLGCAATDTNRPTLCAVNFAVRDGELVLAGADGFRLGVHEVDTDWGQAGVAARSDQFPEMNVPAKTCQELMRLLPKLTRGKSWEDAETVQLYVKRTDDGTPTQLRFCLKRQEVTTMLVQGTFPNYAQLIPKEHTVSVTVDTKDLRRELAAASVLASQSSGIVRFLIGPGDTLIIAARAEEEGEFEAKLPAKVEGEGKIAFSYRWVDGFLKTVGTDAVEIRMTTPSAPGLFLPVGKGDYSQTIMPMFVEW